MSEARLGVIVGMALTVMGAGDILRHKTSGTVGAVLLAIELVAIVVGIVALFLWARLREKRKL
jgi:hypothetical protein